MFEQGEPYSWPGHVHLFHVGEHGIFVIVLADKDEFKVGMGRFEVVVKLHKLRCKVVAGWTPLGGIIDGVILDGIRIGWSIRLMESSILEFDEVVVDHLCNSAVIRL